MATKMNKPDEKKTGKVVDRYDNGNIRYKGQLKNGKMHGAWLFYRRDGSKIRSGSFKDGKQAGIWRTYDRDGKLVKTTKFS